MTRLSRIGRSSPPVSRVLRERVCSLTCVDGRSENANVDWKKHKPLPASRCICKQETLCKDDCQNKVMLYECDDSNCNIRGEPCENRQFAELKQRLTTSGKGKHRRLFDVGIDVVQTEDKGLGVRACRTFRAGKLIVEYAGEVITKEECEERMRNEYRNNKACCIFLLRFNG